MSNDLTSPGDASAPANREEMMAAMFANMIVQQTNMALMLLGRIPHPQTGQPEQDLEGAKMFIDQLEMLAAKTKGNLGKDEDRLLQQSLTGLRMAFVETLGAAEGGPQAAPVAPPPSFPAPQTPPPAASAPIPEEESRKKFSKKY
ncbi:MAG: DUF1844 domain-containing protein [Verrucomicrobia bacterium]|nr:DUF1844 domain-containing protein [Verrucomicrobiota bacterium]